MNKNRTLEDAGKKLKKLRAERGITLQSVSNATGLSVSFLSLVENGKSGISFSNMQKVLKCFDSTIHDLIDTVDGIRVVKFEEA